MAMLVLMLILLMGCGSPEEAMLKDAGGELVLEKGYIDHYNVDYKFPYVDYGELFLYMGEEQPTTGKYANVTPDGKVDWRVGKKEYDETPIAMEMVNKITVDGKAFHLPASFKDIGEEYAIFDKVDFTKVTEDMYPFVIRDMKTGNKVEVINDLLGVHLVAKILDGDNTQIISIGINMKDNNISYISSYGVDIGAHIMSIKEVKVDGVGVGNTLNEVYKKFGVPHKVYSNEVMPKIDYEYKDENNIAYKISFVFRYEMYDYRFEQEKPVRNNVITSVFVNKEERK